MIKYLLDRNEKRSVVMFYSNRAAAEIAYKDLFDEAEEQLGIKTIYTLTDQESIPPRWRGEQGYIDEEMIRRNLPDYRERTYFISDPHRMVSAFQDTLKHLGIPRRQIRTDYFPGFA